MTESGPLFLECETKDGNLGMTTIAPCLEMLLDDYGEWLQRNERVPADVAYAKIFRCRDFACIATLVCEGGAVILQPRRAYGGPFSRLIHGAIFDLRGRWRALKCALQGREILYSEERVNDGAPPEDDAHEEE